MHSVSIKSNHHSSHNQFRFKSFINFCLILYNVKYPIIRCLSTIYIIHCVDCGERGNISDNSALAFCLTSRWQGAHDAQFPGGRPCNRKGDAPRPLWLRLCGASLFRLHGLMVLSNCHRTIQPRSYVTSAMCPCTCMLARWRILVR